MDRLKKLILENQVSNTHLITFVLDETSSMMPRKAATISGFNEWMSEMEKFVGEVLFTLIKFNTDKHELMYKQAVLGETKISLTPTNYRPAAATPLYDAIGRAIRETEDILAKRKDEPSVTFVILTDGEENSSEEWTIASIKQLITEKEEAGWTFTYMGVSQDAWQGGFTLRVAAGNIMNVGNSSESMSSAFAAHAVATTQHLARGGGQTSSYYSDVTDENSQLIEEPDENEESWQQKV